LAWEKAIELSGEKWAELKASKPDLVPFEFHPQLKLE
jgi:hypothetical protein